MTREPLSTSLLTSIEPGTPPLFQAAHQLSQTHGGHPCRWARQLADALEQRGRVDLHRGRACPACGHRTLQIETPRRLLAQVTILDQPENAGVPEDPFWTPVSPTTCTRCAHTGRRLDFHCRLP